MTTQPEALQLAEYHEHLADIPPKAAEDGFILRTARELRRLHAVNAELLEALKTAVVYAELRLHDGATDVKVMCAAIAKAEGEKT
jgi:hypothetical protein